MSAYSDRLELAAAIAVARRWPRHSSLNNTLPPHPALNGYWMGALMARGHQTRYNKLWFPDPCEVAECCKAPGLRPNIAYPFKLRRHADTIRHVAQVCNVNEKTLRARVRKIEGDLHARRENQRRLVEAAIKAGAGVKAEAASSAAGAPRPRRQPNPLHPLTDQIPSIGSCDSAISRLPLSAVIHAAV